MIQITKEQKGAVTVARMVGIVDESAKFDALLNPLPKELHVLCKEIPRISSAGVKAWMKAFQELNAKKIPVKLIDCSSSLVEQINWISNFPCGATIESVMCPYNCSQCKSDFVAANKCADIKAKQFQLPDLVCPKCKGKAVFDDEPDEYFQFLMRK